MARGRGRPSFKSLIAQAEAAQEKTLLVSLQCRVCLLREHCIKNLEMHIKYSHSDDPNGSLPCPVCYTAFYTYVSLERHVGKEHPTFDRESFVPPDPENLDKDDGTIIDPECGSHSESSEDESNDDDYDLKEKGKRGSKRKARKLKTPRTPKSTRPLKSMPCKQCNESFEGRAKLKAHVEEAHKKEDTDDEPLAQKSKRAYKKREKKEEKGETGLSADDTPLMKEKKPRRAYRRKTANETEAESSQDEENGSVVKKARRSYKKRGVSNKKDEDKTDKEDKEKDNVEMKEAEKEPSESLARNDGEKEAELKVNEEIEEEKETQVTALADNVKDDNANEETRKSTQSALVLVDEPQPTLPPVTPTKRKQQEEMNEYSAAKIDSQEKNDEEPMVVVEMSPLSDNQNEEARKSPESADVALLQKMSPIAPKTPCKKTEEKRTGKKEWRKEHTVDKQPSFVVKQELVSPGEESEMDEIRLEEGELNKKQIYQCPYCSEHCKGIAPMLRHLEIHSDTEYFDCDECGKSIPKFGAYIRHERRHLNETQAEKMAREQQRRMEELMQKNYEIRLKAEEEKIAAAQKKKDLDRKMMEDQDLIKRQAEMEKKERDERLKRFEELKKKTEEEERQRDEIMRKRREEEERARIEEELRKKREEEETVRIEMELKKKAVELLKRKKEEEKKAKKEAMLKEREELRRKKEEEIKGRREEAVMKKEMAKKQKEEQKLKRAEEAKMRRGQMTMTVTTEEDTENEGDHTGAAKKSLDCPVCGIVFKYEYNLNKHAADVHPELNGNIYRCSLCPETFPKHSKNKTHWRMKHRKEHGNFPGHKKGEESKKDEQIVADVQVDKNQNTPQVEAKPAQSAQGSKRKSVEQEVEFTVDGPLRRNSSLTALYQFQAYQYDSDSDQEEENRPKRKRARKSRNSDEKESKDEEESTTRLSIPLLPPISADIEDEDDD